jgi:DNA polymerase-3 subunit delta
MILYYYGPDTYAAREAINVLARQEKAQIKWLDRDDLIEDGPGKWIGQGGGSLFGREVIVARDPSKLGSAGQTELWQAMIKSPSGTYVIWERAQPKKDGVLFKGLSKSGRMFPVLGIEQLSSWLVVEAQELGATMDVNAARMMVQRLGSDRWRLIGELEKLALTVTKITTSEVMAAVPEPEQAEIFSVLDAWARGEKARALKGIGVLLEEGNGEFYILAMLAYQLRTLFMVRSGIDQGLKQFEVVREAKIKSYSVQKNWEAAKRRPAVVWRDALTRVLATDFAIKQGRVDARTGVLMLVMGLG